MNKKTIAFIAFLFVITVFLVIIAQLKQQEPVVMPTSLPTPTPIPQSTQFTTPLIEGGGRETKEFKQAEREFLASTPILQSLPSEDLPFFSIEYINETHLIIHSKTTNKQRDYEEAKKWFVENNIDTYKITLEYK